MYKYQQYLGAFKFIHTDLCYDLYPAKGDFCCDSMPVLQNIKIICLETTQEIFTASSFSPSVSGSSIKNAGV